MNRLYIIFLLFSLSCTYSWGQSTGEVSEQGTDWKIFRADNYEIQYPSDWSLDTTQNLGTKFILLAEVSIGKDNFRENITLKTQDFSGYNTTMDQFVETLENQFAAISKEGNNSQIGKLLQSDRKRENGRDFHRVIFSGKQGVLDIKFLQHYFLLDGKIYVLTLTCEWDEFENYQEVAEKILNSFVIKD